MELRYIRNVNTLSEAECAKLKDFRVFVAGCGGLGGYNIELLGRLGIGHITAVDGDVFDETNLNRQILSDESVLGQGKANVAVQRMAKVNSDVAVTAHCCMITDENAPTLIANHDLVIDALDNIPSRFMLERQCEKANIPLVHGAIGGWYGQVTVVYPGERTLSKIYPPDSQKGAETDLGNPSFSPALIASIQVCEAIKTLLRKEDILRGKLLTIDLLHHEYEIFDF